MERVTFHSKESGFCVLRVKARGRRDLVTTVRDELLNETIFPNLAHAAL